MAKNDTVGQTGASDNT